MMHKTLTLTLLLAATAACTAGIPNRMPAESGKAMQATSRIPVGMMPQGIAFGHGHVYVANSAAGTISVIDAATDTKSEDITVGGMPSYMTATPDGMTIANVDRDAGKVRLLEAVNGKPQVVRTLDVGKMPCHAQWSADGNQLVVTLAEETITRLFTFAGGKQAEPAVSAYTVGTVAGTGMGTKAAMDMAGMTPAAGSNPMAMPSAAGAPVMAMAPMKMRGVSFVGGYVIVPNTGENNVSLIDTRTGNVRTLLGGNSPEVVGLAMADGKTTAIIGNTASHSVTLQAADGGEPTTISVGQSPSDIAVRADGKVAFVSASGSNEVSVIDLATRRELTRVPVGKRPGAIQVAPDAAQIWVANNGSDSLTVLDAQSFRVLATVAVGAGKHRVAFGPTKAYVTNSESNDVSVVDRGTLTTP
jgi:YVTN family beta-propeller protein